MRGRRVKPRGILPVLIGAVCIVLAVVLYFVAKVRPVDLLTVIAGAVFLLWQVLLLTVPWNLYFKARLIIHQVAVSRQRGIEAPAGHEEEAARIARRLRLVAIGGHLLSAAVVAVITYFSGRSIGYYFSGFYLLSTLFRPAQAYFTVLRGQLSAMMEETKFPPDDVTRLRAQLADVEKQHNVLSRRTNVMEQLTSRLAQMEQRLVSRTDQIESRLTGRADASAQQAQEQTQAAIRQVQALGRRFEETVNNLSDSRELVTGLKAFLRLLRTEQAET
jgi:uncharacterized protein YukE